MALQISIVWDEQVLCSFTASEQRAREAIMCHILKLLSDND
jgi:hypothetical protein